MQLQFTKRMMRLAVLLLVVQLAWLTWALVSPAGGGSAVRLIGVRAQAARWTVRQFARRLMINIALFGGLLGGMDLAVQLTDALVEGVDWRQVGTSAATGALTGGLLTGLAWAFPTRSLWMLMGQSGVANAGAVLGSELWSGDGSVDWLLVLKGLSSGVAGGADAHWASWSPDGGHRGPGRWTSTRAPTTRATTAPGTAQGRMTGTGAGARGSPTPATPMRWPTMSKPGRTRTRSGTSSGAASTS